MAAAGGPPAPSPGRTRSRARAATGRIEKPFPLVVRVLMRVKTEAATATSLRRSSSLSRAVLLPWRTVLVEQPSAEARGIFVLVTGSVCHLDLVSLQELSFPGLWPKGLHSAVNSGPPSPRSPNDGRGKRGPVLDTPGRGLPPFPTGGGPRGDHLVTKNEAATRRKWGQHTGRRNLGRGCAIRARDHGAPRPGARPLQTREPMSRPPRHLSPHPGQALPPPPPAVSDWKEPNGCSTRTGSLHAALGRGLRSERR